MSICIYGRIERKCMNEDMLEEFLVEFFSTKRDIIKKRNEKCVIYEGICSKNKVTVSFIGEKKPPYNVYDSNIVNDKFEYGQLILFDIKKEEASI